MGAGNMKQEKYFKWGLIGIAIAIILYFAYPIIATALIFSQASVSPETAKAKQVSCDVSIRNPFGLPIFKNGDLLIDSVNCQQQYVSFCGRFGVFSDSGDLKLSGTGGIGDAVSVNVYEGSSASYTLHWCGSVSTQSLTASLYNANGGKLYDKEVKLQ